MSDPKSAWHQLRAGNELFYVPAAGRRPKPMNQTPTAAVFRCADSPVGSAMVFGQSWGSLFEVSTWGHVIDSGVLATIEYAVDTLEVPLIVILGHDECPAMHAAMRAWDEAVIPDGVARVPVQQGIASIVRRGVGTESVKAVTAAHIVETGVALTQRSPSIASSIDTGRCAIVCAGIDSDSGYLRTYATIGPVGDVSDTLLECV
ncbi:carbonic anhydrase [Mycobacterium sp. EPa45]|uniref:carbonic anhydrase n=1 Tax=Mycobacterium sp. EPa45 TaxID=1545728 RepID=UPI00064229B4|nr:carbonic anhydrase [Mycobacterium sp. EPa45]AKK27377.1 hypothetical protein AB431_12635 [Mycobacterium sp. EPa45]